MNVINKKAMMMNKVTSDDVLLLDFHIVQYIPKRTIDPFLYILIYMLTHLHTNNAQNNTINNFGLQAFWDLSPEWSN